MMEKNFQGKQKALKGKLFISGELKLLSGMHIGGSSDFAPIGAVDSPFIRDPFTHAPIIPGSSLKGKLRTLLAKAGCGGYILQTIDNDNAVIARLFGSSKKDMACPARLQFFDLFVTEETIQKFNSLDTDTYIGEVKFENTISRISGMANPRQIERVPAGAVFNFKLVYNIEDEREIAEDLSVLADGFELLQSDYLGGHGSRGYGRVCLENLKMRLIGKIELDVDHYEKLLERRVSL